MIKVRTGLHLRVGFISQVIGQNLSLQEMLDSCGFMTGAAGRNNLKGLEFMMAGIAMVHDRGLIVIDPDVLQSLVTFGAYQVIVFPLKIPLWPNVRTCEMMNQILAA